MADHSYTATCHTTGCMNADVPIVMGYSDEFGMPADVYCGPCGQPIEDITQNPDTTGEEATTDE